ncbi:MAG: hypothetical protein LBI17_03085 [Rickettsiales bacterium]|jgi:hypothetical protein|nr:hypothetical protein [Rickettsiales bacterium]
MDRIAIGITSVRYKGYTEQVKGLLDTYPAAARRVVDSDSDGSLGLRGLPEGTRVDVIAAGGFGLEFLRSKVLADPRFRSMRERGDIGFVFTSDKFHNIPLSGFESILMLAPERAIRRFKRENPGVSIKGLPVDLTSSPSRGAMLASADEFADGDRDAAREIEAFDYRLLMLLGGRVQDEDGNWKENEPAVFAKEAGRTLRRARGANILVGTHGLRSFTRSDGTNSFAPIHAFVDTLRSNVRRGQRILLLSQKEIDRKTRAPALVEIERSGMFRYSLDGRGSPYNFILRDAAGKGAAICATAEQMTLPAELAALGADMRKLHPSYWALTVPSNVETYRSIRRKAALGMKLSGAAEVFAKYKGKRDAKEASLERREDFLRAAGVYQKHK